MKLLVTGGAGFIGINFVRYWLKNYPNDLVTVIDALTYAGNINNVKELETRPNFHFVHADINDTPKVIETLRRYTVDTVVHCAAESHVDRSIADPDIFLKANILGTHRLLEAVKYVSENFQQKCHFHHVSTDEVYGSLNIEDPAFTEKSPYAPNSPYAASKASSDHWVRAYYQTYGLPITISHCSNNFGPYQVQEKLIPLMIHHILQAKSLPVYGKGINVRDWIYVTDHCRALDLILTHGKVGEVYNIGSGCEYKNIDIVHMLCEIIDKKIIASSQLQKKFPAALAGHGQSSLSLISYVEDRKGHDLRYSVSNDKIQNLLGYKSAHEFLPALEETIDWYLTRDL